MPAPPDPLATGVPRFAAFREPDLAERARGLLPWPVAAFFFAQAYFTAIPFLAAVPRWLFEGVRAVLLAGSASGLGGGAVLGWRHRSAPGRAGVAWLAVLALAALACAWVLAGMSIPFA